VIDPRQQLLLVAILQRPVDVDQLPLAATRDPLLSEVRCLAAPQRLEGEALRKVGVPELVVRRQRAARADDDSRSFDGREVLDQVCERPAWSPGKRRVRRLGLGPGTRRIPQIGYTARPQRTDQRVPWQRRWPVDREHAVRQRRQSGLDHASDRFIPGLRVVRARRPSRHDTASFSARKR
jgi:hypothetical protein